MTLSVKSTLWFEALIMLIPVALELPQVLGGGVAGLMDGY